MLLMALGLNGHAQPGQLRNSFRLTPLVVVVAEKDNEIISTSLLQDYQDEMGTSFLQLERRMTDDPEQVVSRLNQVLNDATAIDLQRVYLLLVGSSNFIDQYQFLTESLFFSSHRVLSKTYPLIEDDLRKIVTDFLKSYLWDIRLHQIESDHVSDLRQNAIESGMHFNSQLIVPFYGGFEATIKPAFNAYGLGFYHQWSPRWQVFMNLSGSLNIPGRSKIQREVSAAIFGEEDEVNIDILAHMYFSFGLETRYVLPNWNQKLKPYLGLQLGYSAFRVAENTIEVDPSDFSSSSLSSADGFDGIEFEKVTGVNTGITTGLYYQTNPKWRADFGVRWTQDSNTEPYLNHLAVSVGLQFRFAKRKELFYNYITLDQ